MSLVPLPETLVPFLREYLPKQHEDKLFVTLTWAQSLDARISAEKGVQTAISHLETKTMTHYLRANHDAILVGIGTVLADDPKLNCRFGNARIRPVVVDPHGKWQYAKSTLRSICDQNLGLAPYIVTGKHSKFDEESIAVLESQGGKIVRLDLGLDHGRNWELIFAELHTLGLKSVMVEGGAIVINELLLSSLVDSVVITIGPVFLGQKGTEVSPLTSVKLTNVTWWSGVQDTVMAARIRK